MIEKSLTTDARAVFEALKGSPAVVIHAEGEWKSFSNDKIKLFLPVMKRPIAKWFNTTTPTTVLLFLYPMGTLIGRSPPTSHPILFQGPVGTNNDVNVSPSKETEVTCQIRNLERPELRVVSTGNIPPIEDELYQVVAELFRVGPTDVPVYHRGKQPLLEVAARFDDHQGKTAHLETNDARLSDDFVGEYDSESIRDGVFVFKEPLPERVMWLDVPERWIYAQDVEEIVRSQLSRKLGRDGIRIALKRRKKKKAYFYKASFVLRF